MTIHLNRRHLMLSGAGLALAGCAGGITPAEAARLLPSTQAAMDRHVAAGHVPGISVGVRLPEGQNVFLEAGSLDFDGATPADEDTLWRIYSMTKPITGAAAALLIEDGLLTLDTPVTWLIPEFANLTVLTNRTLSPEFPPPVTRTMTVRHLLTHTAGFTYHFIGDHPVATAYSRAGIFPFTGYNLSPRDIDGPKVRDLDDLARALAPIPLTYEPGTEYRYSISLDVLGLVIQRASGRSFPDFVQRRLFDPIGMDDTVWRLRGAADRRRFAALYNYADGGREVVDPVATTAYAEPVTLFAGGAGLVSSTRDYLAFLTTILDDGRAGRVRVMAPETARMIRTDILPEGVNPENGAFRVGFGGGVGLPDSDTAGEFGWGGAAGTQGWLDPMRRTAGTIMLQQFGQSAPVAGDIRAAIATDIAAA
ncbi:serine hydrolase domain-containing protein [Brevundimonas sp.]|uniref:serine hydrolase domain-containing protein n=1 Tax=Brevundimonas sp. TaxID=1871086 RepID=UPI003918D485